MIRRSLTVANSSGVGLCVAAFSASKSGEENRILLPVVTMSYHRFTKAAPSDHWKAGSE